MAAPDKQLLGRISRLRGRIRRGLKAGMSIAEKRADSLNRPGSRGWFGETQEHCLNWSVFHVRSHNKSCMTAGISLLNFSGRAILRATFLLLAVLLLRGESAAQSVDHFVKPDSPPVKVEPARPNTVLTPTDPAPAVTNPSPGPPEPARTKDSQLRVERLTLAGGSELLTVFGRLDGLKANGEVSPEVPLLSVVRDTLGDNNPENDRLRYVWMLTYTKPTIMK